MPVISTVATQAHTVGRTRTFRRVILGVVIASLAGGVATIGLDFTSHISHISGWMAAFLTVAVLSAFLYMYLAQVSLNQKRHASYKRAMAEIASQVEAGTRRGEYLATVGHHLRVVEAALDLPKIEPFKPPRSRTIEKVKE